MHPFVTVAFILQITLGLAFACGFFIPLAVEVNQERDRRLAASRPKGQPEIIDARFAVLDFLLLALDSIPVFWLLRLTSRAPGDAKAAQLKWRSDPSIRLCF